MHSKILRYLGVQRSEDLDNWSDFSVRKTCSSISYCTRQFITRHSVSICHDLKCRYDIMLKCWLVSPDERPSFSMLVVSVSTDLERQAGYLEFSFSADGFSVNTSKEKYLAVPLPALPPPPIIVVTQTESDTETPWNETNSCSNSITYISSCAMFGRVDILKIRLATAWPTPVLKQVTVTLIFLTIHFYVFFCVCFVSFNWHCALKWKWKLINGKGLIKRRNLYISSFVVTIYRKHSCCLLIGKG